MQQEGKLIGILFTIVAFDKVDGSEMAVEVACDEAFHELESLLVKLINEILHLPLVKRKMFQNNTLLHVIFKVNFLL